MVTSGVDVEEKGGGGGGGDIFKKTWEINIFN